MAITPRGWGGGVVGSAPCQVGWGQVRVWVKSGTGQGRGRVDSVSSWVVSGQGLGLSQRH